MLSSGNVQVGFNRKINDEMRIYFNHRYDLLHVEIRYMLQILPQLTINNFENVGKQIESDPSIDRLIEIRTVLEKIRPIDSKLRYQIDKLVKTIISGTSSSKDPINFKVNILKFIIYVKIDV